MRLLAAIRRFWYPLKVAFLGRGEVADVVDEHAGSAMAVLAGSDLIDAQVPAGTGERMAREIENYLRSIR